jgi:hypothetical protein
MQSDQIFYADQGLRQGGQSESDIKLTLHEAGRKFMHFIQET